MLDRPGILRSLAAAPAPFTFAACLGFYLILSASVSTAEVAAAAASAACATLMLVLLRLSGRSYAPAGARLLRIMPAILQSILRECLALTARFAVSAVSLRMMSGFFERPAFAARDGGSAARSHRALVILTLSLAPNGFVADLDYEGMQILVHRLPRAGSKS